MESTLALSAVVLPDRYPVSAFLADVRDAERAGVRTVWTYDHLTWPLLADGPWYGAVPLLAAAATATERVRLGTLVATPNFRHPVPFAKELMTLDQLSGGRLEVGRRRRHGGARRPGARRAAAEPRRAHRAVRRVARPARPAAARTCHHGPRRAVHRGRCPPAARLRPAAAAAAHRRRGGPAGPGTRGPARPGLGDLRALRRTRRIGRLAGRGRGAVTAADRRARRGGPRSGVVRRVVLLGLETDWPFESAERYADTVGRLARARSTRSRCTGHAPTAGVSRRGRCPSWRLHTGCEPDPRGTRCSGMISG